MERAPFVVLVVIPTTIPFRYPLKVSVVPFPARTAPILAVTPVPTVTPAPARLVVLTPMIWSATPSITQTLRLFAQVPGFFAAQV